MRFMVNNVHFQAQKQKVAARKEALTALKKVCSIIVMCANYFKIEGPVQDECWRVSTLSV